MASVRERLGLRDRLRLRFGEKEEEPKKVALDRHGNPYWVVAGGRLIGARAEDGTIVPVQERRRPDLRSEEAWTRVVPGR